MEKTGKSLKDIVNDALWPHPKLKYKGKEYPLRFIRGWGVIEIDYSGNVDVKVDLMFAQGLEIKNEITRVDGQPVTKIYINHRCIDDYVKRFEE